jgi:hypothetical protein
MKRILLALCAVAALSLTACDGNNSGGTSTAPRVEQYDQRALYFDGTVVATYAQVKGGRTNDYISVVFYEPGNYLVMFSVPPGASTGGGPMPANFRKEIAPGTGPREVIIRQSRIPNYVRITIVRQDGKDESHDLG